MSHRVGLMTAGNMTMEEADDAIAVLTSPDENSSNPENEGRRIEKVVGGWRVLNWKYYRQLAMSQAAREAAAQRQQKRRAKVPEEPVDDTGQNESWTGRPLR